MKKRHVAILGTRGIPANYGGFETFAQELSVRLVRRGYEVTVYCRRGNSEKSLKEFQGVKLVVLPTIRHKYFDTPAHTFFSIWHVVFTSVRIVYICNAINSVWAWIPRMFGKTVVINVDGLEWKRAKWNDLGKWAYRVSERLAAWFADMIISDSRGIQDYYKKQFNRETVFIAYGAERKEVPNAREIIGKFGLQSRRYILYVSRLEPENNAHIMIEAYEKVVTDMPLVIVGHAPYGRPYVRRLHSTQDKRIKFLGGVYGDEYYALQSHAYLYLHGNEVGGTNPALLEALAFGNCVIVNGVDFNREVIGRAGIWFEPGNSRDLKEKIEFCLRNPLETEKYRSLALERICESYTWDIIVEKYDQLFREILSCRS